MPKQDKFQEHFEEITQTYFYVGVTRFKDLRLFNYQAASLNVTSYTGINSAVDFIEIENSVDHSFRIGRIGLNDSADLRKVLPLLGNEILYIEYCNLQAAKTTLSVRKTGFFRVISVEENANNQQVNPGLRNVSRYLTLTIAEFPYVDLLTFNPYSKSYGWDNGLLFNGGEKSVGSLVSDMFLSPLNRESILPMGITYFGWPTNDFLPWEWINYYSPNWSRLKNINFLKRMAVTMPSKHSYYFLNCEGSNISFKSIYQEFLNPLRILTNINFVPAETFNTMKFIDPTPRDLANVLMDVSFKQGGGLGAFWGGFSGSTDFSFDYFSGHTFSASSYLFFRQLTSSNSIFHINFQKHGNQSGGMSYSAFNQPWVTENIRKYEYSKKSFNSLICEATTFISSGRFLGQKANILMQAAGELTENKLVDPVLGADWCVWGYKDIISAQRGICKVTLKKDSTWVPYFGLGGSMLPTP